MNTITTFIRKFSTFLKKKRSRKDGVVVRKIPDRPTPSDADAAVAGPAATYESAETRARFAEAKRRLDAAQAAHNANPTAAHRHLLAEAIDRFQAACEAETAPCKAAVRPIGKVRALFQRPANQNRTRRRMC